MIPSPKPAPRRRLRAAGKSLALVGAGALLAVAVGSALVLADLRFDGGRFVRAAMGSDALAEACRVPLVGRLAERGFEPDEVEFGPEPTIGSPWGGGRSFGDSFTFRDGAGQARVDGVVACVVSGGGVTVEFRVGSAPRRDA